MPEESLVAEETHTSRSNGGIREPPRFSERAMFPADRGASEVVHRKIMQAREPLFQLSIKLSHDEEPEVLKFYDGQDPHSLAL